MNNQIFTELYDKITNLYIDASLVYGHNNTTDNVFRKRQHTVSSKIEDLFAITIYRYLKSEFPESKFCCMIDYSIRLNDKTYFPDIAIIREDTESPILVSYLDIKTDLGYKRDYFENFQNIAHIINELRSTATIGRVNSEGKNIIVNPNLKWRTAVVSDQNISRDQLDKCAEIGKMSAEYLDFYLLSTGQHPNSKDSKKIIQNNDFDRFLNDLKIEFNAIK